MSQNGQNGPNLSQSRQEEICAALSGSGKILWINRMGLGYTQAGITHEEVLGTWLWQHAKSAKNQDQQRDAFATAIRTGNSTSTVFTALYEEYEATYHPIAERVAVITQGHPIPAAMPLTPDELRATILLAKDCGLQGAAEEMGVSTRTVNRLITSARQKLGFKTPAALTAWAGKMGFV